jgi:tRNA A37 threonylcarbamoyladenosine dehydratase
MANVFIIIGSGGTGSSVATMISRMYSNSKIHIIDGDKVEKSNVERQAFQQHDIKKFKAESLAIKLNSAGNPTNEHYFINKYLDNPDIINDIIRKTNYGDQVFIIGCVDNHPARMILESLGLKERLYHNSRDLIYIDSANEE